MGTIVHLCIFFVLTYYRETTAKLCSMHQPVRMNDQYVCSRTFIRVFFWKFSTPVSQFHIFYFPMTFFTFEVYLHTYYYILYKWIQYVLEPRMKSISILYASFRGCDGRQGCDSLKSIKAVFCTKERESLRSLIA